MTCFAYDSFYTCITSISPPCANCSPWYSHTRQNFPTSVASWGPNCAARIITRWDYQSSNAGPQAMHTQRRLLRNSRWEMPYVLEKLVGQTRCIRTGVHVQPSGTRGTLQQSLQWAQGTCVSRGVGRGGWRGCGEGERWGPALKTIINFPCNIWTHIPTDVKTKIENFLNTALVR